MDTYDPEEHLKVLKDNDGKYGTDDGKKSLDEFNTEHMVVELDAVFRGLDMDFYRQCANTRK